MTIVDNYGNDIIKEMPVGNLCLMPLGGTEEITKKIDEYIIEWRKKKVEFSNNRSL